MNLFKKILKWAAFAFAAFCAFCIIVVTCSDNKTEKKQTTESIFGTYEVTDQAGKTFKITINNDETATVTAVGKKETVYYCSWDDDRSINKGISLRFSDGKPYIKYPGGVDDNEYMNVNIKDGWLSPSDKVLSKNPKWRLEAKKVK